MMIVLRRRFWERVLASSPRRVAHVGYNFFRCRADLRPLREALPESALGRLLESRPEVWGMVATPFLCARWTASERIARITDHCATIERLGPLLDTPLDAFVDLLDLHQIDPSYRIVLDQPHWFIRDGLATFSLWEGKDRLISLSYCLSSDGGGLTAYIGGLQGRSEDGVLNRYRRFTKEAEGMRPTDFTVELFRAFCRGLGVTRILAVSDATQHLRSPYFTRQQTAPSTHLNYDALWQDRGGDLQPNGFYELSLSEPRRELDAILAKKRAMYRRRYAMLDAIAMRLDQITRDGCPPARIGRYMTGAGLQAHHALQRLDHATRSYSAEWQPPLLSK
ncbi:DUF535 family protein [Methylorubrum populi]|uniref:DUF535 domain-containing protein n=1 Tax=Methylorubrum populi TaxID=223967 RepID=A0A833J8Q9_9HYPH|nr:DUF535 family protein [Methylorubrum populi]KAB7785386.1 hypothetical protein F8B43_1887 [Methylorubrum populi]